MRSFTPRERFGSFVVVVLLALVCAVPADANGPTIHAGGFSCYSNTSAPIKSGERGFWCNGNTPNFRKSDGTDIALGAGGGGTGNWTFSGSDATVTGAASVSSNISSGSGLTGLTFNNTTAISGSSDNLACFQNAGINKMCLDAPFDLLRFSVAGGGISDAGASNQLAFSASGIYFFGSTFYPFTTDTSPLGASTNRWAGFFTDWYDTKIGAQLTAASTITPTSGVHHVTGTTTVSAIAVTNLPISANANLTLVADSGTVMLTTGGNIATAATIASGTSLGLVYDQSASTWYPQAPPGVFSVYRNATPVASVTTGEIDAQVYTMPANTLVADGQEVQFDAGFHHAANTNSSSYKFYANGTALTTQARTSSGEAETNRWICVRKTSSQMYCTGIISQLGALSTSITLLTSVNYASSIVFKTAVLGATTNGDMTADYLRGEFHP
jgi:hypothetical protein